MFDRHIANNDSERQMQIQEGRRRLSLNRHPARAATRARIAAMKAPKPTKTPKGHEAMLATLVESATPVTVVTAKGTVSGRVVDYDKYTITIEGVTGVGAALRKTFFKHAIISIDQEVREEVLNG